MRSYSRVAQVTSSWSSTLDFKTLTWWEVVFKWSFFSDRFNQVTFPWRWRHPRRSIMKPPPSLSWQWMMCRRSVRRSEIGVSKGLKNTLGVRLNKAPSTPASLGGLQRAKKLLLLLQTSTRSRRQVNHLKSSDYTVTLIIGAVYPSREWRTPPSTSKMHLSVTSVLL